MNKNYSLLLCSLFIVLNTNSIFSSKPSVDEKKSSDLSTQQKEYEQKLIDTYPFLSAVTLADEEKNNAWHHILIRSLKNRKLHTQAEMKAYENYGTEISSLISVVLESLGKNLDQKLVTVKEIKKTLSEINAYSESFSESELAKTKRLMHEFKNYYLFGSLGSVQLQQMRGKPLFVNAWYATPTIQARSTAVSALISQVFQAIREKNADAAKLKQDFMSLLPQHFNQLSAYTRERVEHYNKLFKD